MKKQEQNTQTKQIHSEKELISSDQHHGNKITPELFQEKWVEFIGNYKKDIKEDLPFTLPKQANLLYPEDKKGHFMEGLLFGYPADAQMYLTHGDGPQFFTEVEGDYYVLGVGGHGLNSFAYYFFYADHATKIACRLMHGGAFMDNDRAGELVKTKFHLLNQLVEHPKRTQHYIEFMDHGGDLRVRMDGIDLLSNDDNAGTGLLQSILIALDEPFTPKITHFQNLLAEIYGKDVVEALFQVEGSQIRYDPHISDRKLISHSDLYSQIHPTREVFDAIGSKIRRFLADQFSHSNFTAVLHKLEEKITNLKKIDSDKDNTDKKLKELESIKKLFQNSKFLDLMQFHRSIYLFGLSIF